MKVLLSIIILFIISTIGISQTCIALPPINGTPAASTAPVGWTVWIPSPDIVAGDGPWPGGGGYITSDVDGISGAGGEIGMMLADASFGVTEGLETTLTGLTLGTNYSVSLEWQQATDGVETTFESDGGVDDLWQVATVTFIASGPTASFQCKAIETAIPNVSNRYTIVIDDYICSDLDITVDPVAICAGACVDLEAIATGGEGVVTYEWSPDIVETDAIVTVCPFETTTYQVIGTDEDGHSDTTTATVTVHPVPEVTAIASDSEICEGEEIVLTGEGAETYTWDLGVIDGEAFIPDGLGTITYTVIGTNGFGCEGVATIDIVVAPNPTVTAAASPMEICLGESIVFTGSGADTYIWDGGILDGVAFTPTETGEFEYTVIGTVTESGCTNTALVTITAYDVPIVGATASPSEICLGQSTILSATGADSYSWTGGVIDGASFEPDEAGEFAYTVIGTNTEGECSNTTTISITVHEVPVVGATASVIELCFGESTILNGTGADTYAWTGGVFDGLSFIPDVLGAITYTVTGTNEFGCEGSASIIITTIDCGEPVIIGFEMPNSICINECFTLNDTSSGSIANWAWDFGGATEPNTSDIQNPTICVNTAGAFTITLTLTSDVGEEFSETKDLVVNPIPIIDARLDTIIDLGGQAELSTSVVSDGVFSWSPDVDIDCLNCPSTNASPHQNQTYYVHFIDNNGCSATDSIIVLVNYLLSVGVPTGFSPNGDGNNDVLFVKGEGLTSIHFVIYNRYGEQIFVTTEQSIGWDGSFLNRDQNPGVFTWVLHYSTLDDKNGMLKGNTTLIR
jgi:gliding motility-associated-like protein